MYANQRARAIGDRNPHGSAFVLSTLRVAPVLNWRTFCTNPLSEIDDVLPSHAALLVHKKHPLRGLVHGSHVLLRVGVPRLEAAVDAQCDRSTLERHPVDLVPVAAD